MFPFSKSVGAAYCTSIVGSNLTACCGDFAVLFPALLDRLASRRGDLDFAVLLDNGRRWGLRNWWVAVTVPAGAREGVVAWLRDD